LCHTFGKESTLLQRERADTVIRFKYQMQAVPGILSATHARFYVVVISCQEDLFFTLVIFSYCDGVHRKRLS